MSNLIKYVPVDDLAATLAEYTKAALMDLPEFQVTQPGFTVKANSRNQLVFPQVGVDFRTVAPTGHTGSFHPEVITPTGLTSRLVFDTAQTGEITIPDYKTFSTYFVGVVDDLPFNLFTWVNDPDSTDKMAGTIPVSIPIIRGFNVLRTSGRGEYIRIDGYFTVYGGSTQGGISNVKAETAKLYHAVRSHPEKFSAQGLTQILVDPPEYSTFTQDAVLYEGVIKFTCVARIF